MRTMTKTASVFLFAISACPQLTAATPRESLIALKLPNTTITPPKWSSRRRLLPRLLFHRLVYAKA